LADATSRASPVGLTLLVATDGSVESFRTLRKAVQRIPTVSGEEYVHGVIEVDEKTERRIDAVLPARR
jgi:hypothetical protein